MQWATGTSSRFGQSSSVVHINIVVGAGADALQPNDLWDARPKTPVVEGSASVPCLRMVPRAHHRGLFFLFFSRPQLFSSHQLRSFFDPGLVPKPHHKFCAFVLSQESSSSLILQETFPLGSESFYRLFTMLDSFFLRSGSEELAKMIHSLSGAVTTIFLFTRLWARTSLYKGLWWDDYIRTSTAPGLDS